MTLLLVVSLNAKDAKIRKEMHWILPIMDDGGGRADLARYFFQSNSVGLNSGVKKLSPESVLPRWTSLARQFLEG